MHIKNLIAVLCLGACLSPLGAQAEDVTAGSSEITPNYQLRYNWHNEPMDYALTTEEPGTLTALKEISEDPTADSEKPKLGLDEEEDSEHQKRLAVKESFEDKVMAILPYSKTLKHTWNVVDGDVDLIGVKGLRFDRGNKGLEYKTSFIPFMGDVDGVEMSFYGGEDLEFKFESSAIPFVGKVDGFHLKAKAKEDESRVYVSYTYKFD